MIYLSIGLPGRFAEWCEAVVARLAATLGGPLAVEAWPSLDEMLGYRPLGRALDQVARRLVHDAPAQLVVGVRQPDEGLRCAFAETALPFVLALDDPRVAVSDIVAGGGIEPAAATRVVANCCPFVMRYTEMPGALALHANAVQADAVGAVAAIARHLRIPVADSTAATIAAGLPPPAPTPIADDARKTLDGALAAYDGVFAGGAMGRIVWTRELFACGDDPRQKPLRPIELAGGARCLIYGPYIHLSSGSWNARVVLGFSREAMGHIFMVDACCAGRQIASVSFQADDAGVHTAELGFSLGAPAGNGLEIRVMVLSERALGQLAFGHVVLTPLTLAHGDAAAQPYGDFAAVLEL